MVNTRSKARSRQPLDRAASPRVNAPRRVSLHPSDTSQQSLEEGVDDNSVPNTRAVGGRPVSSAAESNRPKTGFRKCRSDCKTCPALVKNNSVKSNMTGRVHALPIDVDNINCKVQNYVYVLQCSSCFVQYVGESAVSLNLRMNIHRKGKSGCEISIDHYKNVCPGATFTIQILELLPGDGYLNGKIDPAMLKLRLEREDYWIKTLRSIYPYGLNDRVKSMDKDIPAGKLFPPLPRHGTRFVEHRSRSKVKARISDLDSLVHSIFSFSTGERSNKCRILFDRLRQSNLRKLAEEASTLLFSCKSHLKRWYELLIDIFLTKDYENRKT